MPRSFIGWSIPSELREQIGSTAGVLKHELPAASWTRPETFHVTFAFLGEQPESLLSALGDALTESMKTIPTARTAIGTAGFFPSPERPRVGWLGVADQSTLRRIAEAVREVVTSAGIELDKKPFHAHLTLARLKSRWRSSDVNRFLSAWNHVQSTPLIVDSVTLFESHLGLGGAKHHPRIVAHCRPY